MKVRTTMYVEKGIITYLHDQKVNCTEIANSALRDHAIGLGYENLDDQIRFHQTKLETLQKQVLAKDTLDEHNEKFYLALIGYLSTRSIEAHTITHIKAWLLGPGNRQFSDIIGHPSNLTEEKVQELIIKANAYDEE